MEFTVKGKRGQRLVVAVAAVAFIAATVWIASAYVASVLGRRLSIPNLQLATRLDPGNPEYHIRLGRLYQYSLTDAKPEEAIAQFRRAAELAPEDPDAWLNLAAALEFNGNVSESEKCLRRADLLAPNLPRYQWSIANYYLLHGDTEEAFRHLKVVLAGTREYDNTVFSTVWKASQDSGQILQQVVPRALPAEFSYLEYLISKQRFDPAHALWERIASSRDAFDPHEAAVYIDSLIRAGQPAAAYQVWTDLQAKGLVPPVWSGSQPNLIENGEFEDPLLSMGFGWRLIPVEGVYAGPDTSMFHSPGHSFFIQFTGSGNLNYQQFYQLVKVSPNHAYTLQALIKTENITTDSGPRLEVQDIYNPEALNASSEQVIGTTEGWQQVSLPFRTGPKTELIVVKLARTPSDKFDNSIKGKLWLDDVQLTSAPSIGLAAANQR